MKSWRSTTSFYSFTVPLGDTIVALATPAGESALAVIRISGSQCAALAKMIFSVDSLRPRYAILGQYQSREGRVLDRLIYIFYAEGASYTGEAMLELSCHGNPFIQKTILADLLARGCRMAEPGEFTRTAFLNGKMELTQAEAVAEIIQARSHQALAIAQKQLSGALGKRIQGLMDRLLGLIAHFEAYIDFPEEDLPPEDEAGPLHELIALQEALAELIRTEPYRKRIGEGVRVALIGEPNAGKSSLLNALLNDERVLVSETPGTTRDFVEASINLGPYPVHLVDTAGLRETASGIERLGIDKTLQQAAMADWCLWVVDASQPKPAPPAVLAPALSEHRVIIALNKRDLPECGKGDPWPDEILRCRISALTGEGIDRLKTLLQSTLEQDVYLPAPDQVTVSARHTYALQQAQAALTEALGQLRRAEPTELAVSGLREALSALGTIVGAVDNERVLDRLFASFCIGK